MDQPSDKSPLISPFISGIFLAPGGHSKQRAQQRTALAPSAGEQDCLGQATLENQMLIFTTQVWIASW